MADSFHSLLSDVQTRERRNRATTLSIVAMSLVASLLFLFVLTRYYPRWCAYAAIPLAPAALYWVCRAGIPLMRVSRIDAAALIDRALFTQNRGVTLIELEESPDSTHSTHIDILTRQLSAIISSGTSSAAIHRYEIRKTERRAIKSSLIALLLCGIFFVCKPLSTHERLARDIEAALNSSPDLPPPLRELTMHVLETMRDPSSSTSEVRSAIQDARRALEMAPASRSPTSQPPLVITPSAQSAALSTPSQAHRAQSGPTTVPKPQTKEDRSPATQTQASTQESNREKKQERSNSTPSSVSSTEESHEKGAGQQQAGEGSHDESSPETSQSQKQTNSNEESGSSGESGQQSRSNTSSNKGSEQSDQQQSGGAQGSGSGTGGAGTGFSNDSQKEGEGSGSGSARGKGGGKAQGQDGAAASDASQAGAAGASGGQALSEALANAERSLDSGSSESGSDKPQSEKEQKESSNSRTSSGGNSPGNMESNGATAGSTSESKEARTADRGRSDNAGTQSKRGAQGEAGSSNDEENKKSDQSQKEGGSPSSPRKPGAESAKRGEQPSQKGSTGESGKEHAGETETDEQTREKQGDQDGKGEKSRVVEGKATPRNYEDGGLEGAPGPGLGGREGYKDVQLGSTQESFDTRYTGVDSTEEEGKVPAQPRTTIEDLTLSKPKPAIDRGEQRIPLEYRDILR